MNKRKLCRCAFLGALLLAAPAHAWIVFDPSNYSQNVLTAARTLEQINNQIRQLQNEAVMLQNMAKNLSTLNYSSLNQMTGALTNIGSLMTQADGLSFNLTQLESQWEQQYPDSYDATVSTNDIAVAAQRRWQNAMNAFRQTMQVQSQIVQNVQADQPILSDLVNQSQNAEGALQAQQASNQLIALSTKQQMQIQEMLASQYRAQSEDAARKAQAEEAARETTQQFLGSETAYSGSW
ncbi:MAG: P-type conjugative transfer protein TrbJ [Alphaproteobacteria bacterium]|nr:P-type conjugative transfer protein TrbJ [Alphaproteobacteria bacterium]